MRRSYMFSVPVSQVSVRVFVACQRVVKNNGLDVGIHGSQFYLL